MHSALTTCSALSADVARFLMESTASHILASLGLQEQVELNMLHLGEAAARISDDIKDAHPEIPWHEMAGMRNILVHEYFRVKPIVLFETVTTLFSELERQLDSLQAEYPL